jgi:hypothetical protein
MTFVRNAPRDGSFAITWKDPGLMRPNRIVSLQPAPYSTSTDLTGCVHSFRRPINNDAVDRPRDSPTNIATSERQLGNAAEMCEDHSTNVLPVASRVSISSVP